MARTKEVKKAATKNAVSGGKRCVVCEVVAQHAFCMAVTVLTLLPSFPLNRSAPPPKLPTPDVSEDDDPSESELNGGYAWIAGGVGGGRRCCPAAARLCHTCGASTRYGAAFRTHQSSVTADKMELFSDMEGSDASSVLDDEFDGEASASGDEASGDRAGEGSEEEEEDDDEATSASGSEGSDYDESGGSDADGDMERASARLDRAAAGRRAAAEAETAELAGEGGAGEGLVLPDEAARAEEAVHPDLPGVRRRIKDIVRTLDAFAARRDGVHTRAEYTDQLKRDLVTYYSYNDFMIDALFNLFSASEAVELIESCEVGGGIKGEGGLQGMRGGSSGPTQRLDSLQRLCLQCPGSMRTGSCSPCPGITLPDTMPCFLPLTEPAAGDAAREHAADAAAGAGSRSDQPRREPGPHRALVQGQRGWLGGGWGVQSRVGQPCLLQCRVPGWGVLGTGAPPPPPQSLTTPAASLQGAAPGLGPTRITHAQPSYQVYSPC